MTKHHRFLDQAADGNSDLLMWYMWIVLFQYQGRSGELTPAPVGEDRKLLQ